MAYRMTMSEAKALFDAKCGIRMSGCGAGANNGKHCAEMMFNPTGEVFATEYGDTEEIAWKKAFAHLDKAPTVASSEQLTSQNAALQDRIAELQAQLNARDGKGNSEESDSAPADTTPKATATPASAETKQPARRGRPPKATATPAA